MWRDSTRQRDKKRTCFELNTVDVLIGFRAFETQTPMINMNVLFAFTITGIVAASGILTNAVASTNVAAESSGEVSAPKEPLSLWYRKPAAVWTEALPV